MRKSRASSSAAARAYRQAGHDNALKFALAIGLTCDYQNDKRAKKDVIDKSGDAHSVKSGKKHWQIFLYSRKRFVEDDGFQALNGVGTLLVHCIDSFPPSFREYKKNPIAAKQRLRTPMREIKDRLQRKALLRAFLGKAIFNSGEVDYLTALHDDGKFHVFRSNDVVQALGEAFTIENSGSTEGVPDQKVLFRYDGKTVGELEMRHDSAQHYQEVKFNMKIQEAMSLLLDKITPARNFNDRVVVHGAALKKFGRWPKG